MKKFGYIIVAMFIVALSIGCTSCDEEEPYQGPAIIGSWVMIESNGTPIDEWNADYYDFYDNGEGDYGYYDRFGRYYTEPFVWSISGTNHLFIRYNDPALGVTSCFFDYDGNYLYFSETPDFYYYNVFARSYY